MVAGRSLSDCGVARNESEREEATLGCSSAGPWKMLYTNDAIMSFSIHTPVLPPFATSQKGRARTPTEVRQSAAKHHTLSTSPKLQVKRLASGRAIRLLAWCYISRNLVAPASWRQAI